MEAIQIDYSSPFDYTSAFKYEDHSILKSDGSGLFFSGYQPLSTEKCENETVLSKLARKIIVSLYYALIIISFPISLWICLKRVHALERLVVLRLGKLQPLVGPGFYLKLPFIDKCIRVNLEDRTMLVHTKELLTADGAIVKVSASIKYCVSNAVQYVTRLQNQDNSVFNLSSCSLTSVISQYEQSDFQKKCTFISSKIKESLNKTMCSWGLEILCVTITSVQVLKEAEPQDPLNNVLRAFQSGKSSICAPLPVCSAENLVLQTSAVTRKTSSTSDACSDGFTSNISNDMVLQKITALVETYFKLNANHTVSAIYELRITGKHTKVIYLSFNMGHYDVFEQNGHATKSDVVITLSMEDIEDMLALKLSPLTAYFEGRLEASGDINLLGFLSEILSVTSA